MVAQDDIDDSVEKQEDNSEELEAIHDKAHSSLEEQEGDFEEEDDSVEKEDVEEGEDAYFLRSFTYFTFKVMIKQDVPAITYVTFYMGLDPVYWSYLVLP